MTSSATVTDQIKDARALWLSEDADIAEVERLYRSALHLPQEDAESTQDTQPLDDNHANHDAVAAADGNGPQQGSEQKRMDESANEANDDEPIRKAKEQLSLILCQSARADKANALLSQMSYECRLASVVLDYPMPATATATLALNQSHLNHNDDDADDVCCPCRVYDDFLTAQELQILKNVFESPSCDYWTEHAYAVEPPSPYFSYLIPFQPGNTRSILERLIQKIYQQLLPHFPNLAKATCVEMWAHNRPHASGHQLHFDSDNEGIGGIRNPIISTILYITGNCGGPSLVTDQKLIHKRLAQKGWMSHAKERRLVAFDGKVLHGVIPGKGSSPSLSSPPSSPLSSSPSSSSSSGKRRVTLMLAFWKKIEVREGDGPGAARMFPTDSSWAKQLRQDATQIQDSGSIPRRTRPLSVAPIYETLDGQPWTRQMGMPQYDQVFQGF